MIKIYFLSILKKNLWRHKYKSIEYETIFLI